MAAKIKKNNTKVSVKTNKKATKLKKKINTKLTQKATIKGKNNILKINKNKTNDKSKIKKAKVKNNKLNKPKVSSKSKNTMKKNSNAPQYKDKKTTKISKNHDNKNDNKTIKKNIIPLTELSGNENDNEVTVTVNYYQENSDNNVYSESNHLDGPSKFQPYQIDHTEEYMNEQQLEHFANILEAWKQELMLEVDHTITEMKEADILADPNDRATQEETFNLELRTRDRERKLIKKIESALNKISEKKYGYCDACGIEIGIRRLEARPTATLCIECKTLAEIREKRS